MTTGAPLKTVLLLGDSIRAGYQSAVSKELADVAEVSAPQEDVCTTTNLLVNLFRWVALKPPDVFHINCGLHDLKTILYGVRDNMVALAHYQENVERILRIIREHTKTKVSWATITQINEQKVHAKHARAQDFDRFESDVDAYNRAAVEVANRLRVPINDLHAVIMKAGRDQCLTGDGVHFTPAASELLGK